MDLEHIITWGVGIITGGVGKIIVDWWKFRRDAQLNQARQEATDKLAANAQAFELYKQMVQSLQETVNKLTEEQAKSHLHYAEEIQKVERDNSELRSTIKACEAKLEILTNSLSPLVQNIYAKLDIIHSAVTTK